MARELIKITASILRAGKPFAREIFLRMPKNQKMLRLVQAGDEIRPALLARLLDNREAEIFAQPLDSDPMDGPSLDLYGDEPASESASFPPDTAGFEAEAQFTADENLTESRRIRAADREAQAEARFGGDMVNEEEETIFGNESEADAEETFLVGGNLAEAVENFSVPARQRREEKNTLGRLLGLAAEGFAAYTADPGSAHEETRSALVAALSEAFSEVARQESAGSEIPHVLRALRDSLGRVSEAVTRGDLALPANADLPALSEHLSGFVQEFKATLERPTEEVAFESRLELVAKEYAAFSEELAPEGEAVERLRETLDHCVFEIQARVAVKGAISPDLLTVKDSLLRAIDSLPITSRIAKAYRDTPLIAARFASLLAHSLGYASPQYLYDVAFTAHLFFAGKNGAPLSPSELSPMAEALLSAALPTDHAGTPLGDSASILHFLDRYFESPDCDRTKTEFEKRAFENTLRVALPNEWTAARWRYFVDEGPSLKALSACSKAAAKANRTARGPLGETA
jgi:hypothetical protein